MEDPFAPYLDQQPEPFHSDLAQLAARIETRLPEGATRVISYTMPGWRVPAPKGTKMAFGMAGFTAHMGVYPHSGNVVPQIAQRLDEIG